jgi:DNA polymerase-3 subunit delta'
MLFQSIPGLVAVKEKLIRSVQAGKIPHAQLFMGKEGALTLPLALAYATYIHCQNRKEADACGTCAACSKNLKYIHPDTSFVFPVGNVKGDKDEERFRADMLKNWRAFLLEQPFGTRNDWSHFYGGEDKQALISRDESREIIRALSLKPFESACKVMIIWQPETMHTTAANGILKILEEPPPNTFFILVSTSAEHLLPTIVSRTQRTQVPMLEDDALERFLRNHVPAGANRIAEVVRMADGDLALARELMETEQDEHHEQFVSWMRACFGLKFEQLVPLAETFHDLDRLQQRTWLTYSLAMMREALLHLGGASGIQRVTGIELSFIQNFSRQLTVARIEKIQLQLGDAIYFLERNGSAKMIFLDLSIQIGQIFRS